MELSTEKFARLQLSLHSFSFSFIIKTTKMLAILNPLLPSPLPCRLTLPLSHNLVSSSRSFLTHIWVTGCCHENEIQLRKRRNVEITLAFRTFFAYVGIIIVYIIIIIMIRVNTICSFSRLHCFVDIDKPHFRLS